jgi:hypothetical protein
MTVHIGLLDSGTAAAQAAVVAAARGFALNHAGEVIECPATPDPANHGAMLADIILRLAPSTRLLDAQVFRQAGPAAPAIIAAGVDWLVANGARVINLSLGLREDRPVLRDACTRAVEQGILLVAATPARGGPVYPAAYPGVLRVCGDARCGPGEWSLLPEGPTHLGACPRPFSAIGQCVGGASIATAHVTGLLAAHLAGHPLATQADLLRYLETGGRFHGRERRSG